MYLREEFEKFSADIKKSVKMWGEKKIDELCAKHPRMQAASVYLKRGLSNWLDREEAQVDDMVSTLALFAADKEGKIDIGSFVDDAVSVFREMDVNYTKFGAFGIEYGKGAVTINIPRNVLLDMIFGDLGQIKITAEDLLEIKSLITETN